MVTSMAVQDDLGRSDACYGLFFRIPERALAGVAEDRCIGVSWSLHFLVLVHDQWIPLAPLG
jgi:hypothetical protein